MSLRVCVAAGIGLALLHSTSAYAEPNKVRHHSIRQHSANDPSVDNKSVATTSIAYTSSVSTAAAQPSVEKRSVAKRAGRTRSAARQPLRPRVRQAPPSAAPETDSLAALKTEIRDLRQQVGEVESLRKELAEVKQKLWGSLPFMLTFSRPQAKIAAEPKAATLKLPDVSDPDPEPPQAPVNPATATLPAAIEEELGETLPPKSAVEEAKTFLIKTATPGYTMQRQGVRLSIERLHPAFAVKIAEAVRRAREAGLSDAGISSAYRPPAFGVGGFSDKFNSLHSYGLAADMTGIGSPGSKAAHLWQSIVEDVGLHLPYGANNRAEFNHTQLIPAKVAPGDLRETITAKEPKDLPRMWLASGIDSYVAEATQDEAKAADDTAEDGEAVQSAQVAAEDARTPDRSEGRTAPKVSKPRSARNTAKRTRLSAASRHGKSGSRRKAST
jgi:hypothetical protein